MVRVDAALAEQGRRLAVDGQETASADIVEGRRLVRK
jgi:hypothetical protein